MTPELEVPPHPDGIYGTLKTIAEYRELLAGIEPSFHLIVNGI
jgi:hypothetical protein